MSELTEAVFQFVRGQQVDVTLEADQADGKVLSFIESHARVHDRQFEDGKVQMRAIMGKRTLAELARNGAVEIKKVEPAPTHR
jgi:50S ribosomal subunit-associated GTPase HflX